MVSVEEIKKAKIASTKNFRALAKETRLDLKVVVAMVNGEKEASKELLDAIGLKVKKKSKSEKTEDSRETED